MNLAHRLVGGLAALALLLAGLTLPAAAEPYDPDNAETTPEGLPDAAVVAEQSDVDPEEEHIAVFSADVRVDGVRLDDEWYLALGYSDEYPYFASLWLLVDAEADEWEPLCVGYLLGDEEDEGAIFVGGSTFGEEDDGCMLVGLGDGGVVIGAIELEGESVVTAAMYAFD